MSSTYAGKEPEDDAIALALAQALTQALGLAGGPPSAVIDAYLAMLRGGACAEVSGKPAALAQSLDPRLATAASDNDQAPLVLKLGLQPEHTLVYLRVMDDAERKFEAYVRELFVPRATPWKFDEQAPYLASLRLDEGDAEPQKLKALRRLAQQRSIVLTGGPGTGKTYALRALLWLAGIPGGIAPADIRLLAPTNRGAREMASTLQDTVMALGTESWELEAKALLTGLPAPRTIHRALLDRDDLAKARCVVVDEASMVDLVLFSRLLEAVDRQQVSLLIVGDPDQLPSVDVGTVLADLCHSSVFFADTAIVRLAGSKRNKDKAIVALAESVCGGNPGALVDAGYCRTIDSEAILKEACDVDGPFAKIRELAMERKDGWEIQALALTKKLRVLCSLRVGPLGAVKLSGAIMRKLGLSSAEDDGCVIMVTQNDVALGVVNGEVGVVAGGRVVLADAAEGFRTLALSELPAYELAYASTIHKAQGAEYQKVIIVIPDSAKDAFLSCELLYTAITRTKGSFVIFGDGASIRKLQPVKRASGLAARLRK